jgi:GNAT superfamily N-acetyltransferase
MVTTRPPAYEIRRAEADDRPAVLALLAASLGWSVDDRFGEFFAWKHDENAFGPSPSWVAVADGRIVGSRTFLRWEFERPDGSRCRAVRAVDTASHPDFQGQGIFRRLTLHGLDELAVEGIDLVFNTPNDKSRPGYLKMGWSEVGRLPTTVRPSSPAALVRMVRARVPAERWSEVVWAGRPAPEVLEDPALEDLLASQPPPTGLRTWRSAAQLRWRYGFGPLAYRAVTLGRDGAEGVAVFRVRRRGSAMEGALCEVLAPGGDPGAATALSKLVARCSGADYVLRIGGPAIDRAGFVRMPGQGPTLTRRAVQDGTADGAALDGWALTLGDVELF